MRVRSKPVVVEAIQWWSNINVPHVHTDLDGFDAGRPYVITEDQYRHYLFGGCWLLPGLQVGQYEVLTPQEFERRFEPC